MAFLFSCSWQSGTEFDEQFVKAATETDGSMVISGYTDGSWATTNNGGWDFVAMSINVDRNILWEYQVRLKAISS